MFGLSFSHLLLLSVIALVVIGPKQLPEVARLLGRFINDLKRTSGEITKSFAEIRDNQNQSILQHNQNHEPAPVVGHEPSGVTHDTAVHRADEAAHAPTLGDQLGGQPRNFNATGAAPLADRPYQQVGGVVETAVDEHHQMSFEISNEKPDHGN